MKLLSHFLCGIALATSTATFASPEPSTTVNRSHHRIIFIGGTHNFADIASSVSASIATGKIGLYEHGNGMAALTSAQRSAIQATWGATGASLITGGGTGVGEVGAATASQIAGGYVGFFGGSYPGEVNMNYQNAGAGSGSYTASAPDSAPGRVYGCFMSKSDLATVKSDMSAAVRYGARNIALVSTPNCGTEDIVDLFATSRFWANVRAAVLYGGALALDVPPSYALQRTSGYVSFIAQMIAWADSVGIRSSLILSPYAVEADTKGQSGAQGYDPKYLARTQTLIARLRSAGALPTQFIVENYAGTAPADSNYPAGDGVAGSLNEVADFLATTTATAPAGTTVPGVPGGVSEVGIEPTLPLQR